MPKRFALVVDGQNEVIRDVERNLNVFYLGTNGMGVTADIRKLAEKVVEHLNSLPSQDGIPKECC